MNTGLNLSLVRIIMALKRKSDGVNVVVVPDDKNEESILSGGSSQQEVVIIIKIPFV